MNVQRSFVCNSQKWKQPKYLSTDEQISEQTKAYTYHKYYSATTKKEWVIDKPYNMDCKIIMPGEWSQIPLQLQKRIHAS